MSSKKVSQIDDILCRVAIILILVATIHHKHIFITVLVPVSLCIFGDYALILEFDQLTLAIATAILTATEFVRMRVLQVIFHTEAH